MSDKESPYAYAKACGIISKSYIGKNINLLSAVNSLNEFNRLLFPKISKEETKSELLNNIILRITSRTIKQIISIINGFQSPPEIILQMIRSYEYNNLKKCIQNISLKKNIPPIYNIGIYSTINYDVYPDFHEMIRNTEFIELIENENKKNLKFNDLEQKIDYLYYKKLFDTLKKLNSEDSEIIIKFINDEIILRNCNYALRLKYFYHKSRQDIEKYLIKINGLEKDAIELCEFKNDLFSYSDNWENWKWYKILSLDSDNKEINAKHFQNTAAVYLYRQALKGFRIRPMSISAIFCFIKLKQFEEDLLISICEGLALGMESREIFNLLEVA